ncbi:hypothetical protein, partial [Rhizobium leguminosarum]|uniref:hypothetical protein n=1 Tax=Rhizobium leguminosarum TaxID=384 RepID=UPI003F9E5151
AGQRESGGDGAEGVGEEQQRRAEQAPKALAKSSNVVPNALQSLVCSGLWMTRMRLPLSCSGRVTGSFVFLLAVDDVSGLISHLTTVLGG